MWSELLTAALCCSGYQMNDWRIWACSFSYASADFTFIFSALNRLHYLSKLSLVFQWLFTFIFDLYYVNARDCADKTCCCSLGRDFGGFPVWVWALMGCIQHFSILCFGLFDIFKYSNNFFLSLVIYGYFPPVLTFRV